MQPEHKTLYAITAHCRAPDFSELEQSGVGGVR